MNEVNLLALVIQTPGALPPCVWGPPGIGKSARFAQLAKLLDMDLETVIASVRDPSDFAGLPVPENGHGVRLEPPSWAVRCKAKGKGLVFFDEASTAPPATQAALLRVVLERWVGDCQLPDGVKIALAANPTEQAAGGWDLSAPMANRLVHLQWPAPSVESWTDWLSGLGSEAKIPVIDPERWAKEFSQAKALASAFLRRRPGLLSEDIAKVAGRFPLAYATPRTWECAVRLLASCRAVDCQDEIMGLLSGCLGEPVALEFVKWLRENDLPDPEALLKNPDSWTPNEKQPDRAFAVCLAVTDCAVSNQDRKSATGKKIASKRWHAAWNVLDRVMPIGKDIVAIAARRLADPQYLPEGGMIDPEVRAVIGKIREVVSAAGTA